ncbi:MAG: hypothetical protein ACM3JQ_06675, partial [Candidatus Eiseniibacteriota bacterium]
MAGSRKFREGTTVVTLSLILLITVSNSLPNVIASAYALFPHFGSAGDWSCSSNAKNTLGNIVNHGGTTALAIGDLSYQTTATCWFDIIKPLDGDANPGAGEKRVKITIGNHDDDSTSLLNSYKNHFHLNKLYYSFNRGFVHVLVLNSQDPNRSDKNSDQYKFAQSDLQAAHNNPNVK